MVATIRGNYDIRAIPQNHQRFETIGDWIPPRRKSDPAKIRVSEMSDPRYIFLVAVHEIIEYEGCMGAGITDRAVVAFDKRFLREQKQGKREQNAEPGDALDAPYRERHQLATKVEMLVAEHLGVVWEEYVKECDRVSSTWNDAFSFLRK